MKKQIEISENNCENILVFDDSCNVSHNMLKVFSGYGMYPLALSVVAE